MTKRLVIPVDGRSIIILINSSAEESVHNTFVSVITEVCQNEFVAKSFPEITFHLEDESNNGSLGFTDFDKAKEGFAVITLYVSNIFMSFGFSAPEVFKEVFRDGIKRTVIHEFTHLWQYFTTKVISQNIAATQTLLKKSLQLDKSVQGIGVIRYVMRHFFQKLFFEGLANFNEKFQAQQLIFSEDTFDKFVYEANECVQIMIVKINEIQKLLHSNTNENEIAEKLKEFYESLSGMFSYTIGEHMVYAILFIDHTKTLSDLLTFELFDFVAVYESCMLQKKFVPIVSGTSGKGIFDYKREVDKLTLFYEEFKQKSS